MPAGQPFQSRAIACKPVISHNVFVWININQSSQYLTRKQTTMKIFLLFLSVFVACTDAVLAVDAKPDNHRTYSGYVERWQSVGTYRYALMNKKGEAIIYIGDDYPNDLGNDKKRAVRECLNEAVALGARVEIGGEWVKLEEGAEGFDEKTITCRILK